MVEEPQPGGGGEPVVADPEPPAENVMVEDPAPADPPAEPPAPAKPPLFSDVYGAASQAFADSRANLVAKKAAVDDANTASDGISAEKRAMEDRHAAEKQALSLKADDADAAIMRAQDALRDAQEDDKEAARALYNVLGGYIGDGS